jgi:hypothetical protein
VLGRSVVCSAGGCWVEVVDWWVFGGVQQVSARVYGCTGVGGREFWHEPRVISDERGSVREVVSGVLGSPDRQEYNWVTCCITPRRSL